MIHSSKWEKIRNGATIKKSEEDIPYYCSNCLKKTIQRKEIEMKNSKINTIFMNKLNYIKKNLTPGSVVAMKDQRTIKNSYNYVSRDDEKTYVVEKLYDNYALCVNDIGLTECFGYYDLTVAYEHGKLSLYDVNWRR